MYVVSVLFVHGVSQGCMLYQCFLYHKRKTNRAQSARGSFEIQYQIPMDCATLVHCIFKQLNGVNSYVVWLVRLSIKKARLRSIRVPTQPNARELFMQCLNVGIKPQIALLNIK